MNNKEKFNIKFVQFAIIVLKINTRRDYVWLKDVGGI